MKSILDYSTTVPVTQTIGEIMATLSRSGVQSIQTDYQGGEPCGLSFLMMTRFGERSFRLPVRVDEVQAVLRRDYHFGKIRRSQTTPLHAARVAWRVVKDWLEAQLALIDAGQADLTEVFLPYLETESGQTLYQRMVGSHLLLTSGRETAEEVA